jgi:alpha-L-fucosidase
MINITHFKRAKASLPQLLVALVLAAAAAQVRAADDWPKADPAALAHWQSLRFGMFIHWGPVSLTGHEIGWSRGAQTPVAVYDNLYQQFNPANFNADEWVNIAKSAGMKYIVLTAKHHDGFCLWDTKLTDYNIMHTPFHRDVVKELAAACKKQGLGFGAYYSTCDWYNTNWPVTSPGGTVKRDHYDLDAYEQYLQGQISELITNYGPLITVWNDVPAPYGKRGADTIKLARRLQPNILINDRTGDGGDYSTPEQEIGKFQMNRPWESCMTVSKHNAWAWGGADDGVKSAAACLGMVIRAAGGDGNVLLNVGPRPDGLIDSAQANLLKDIGAWLSKNGAAIYGTRGGPWKPTKNLVSTRQGNTIYLHVLKHENPDVKLPGLPKKILSAKTLAGDKVQFAQSEQAVEISLPAPLLDPVDTIIRLELDGPAMDIAPVEPAAPAAVKATASNVYQGNEAAFGPQLAFDNDEDTRWATDNGTKAVSLTATLAQPATISGVRIQEAAPYVGRVSKFEFHYRDGNSWKSLFNGERIGAHFEKRFQPVTAREFRLNILDASEGPTISEMELIADRSLAPHRPPF